MHRIAAALSLLAALVVSAPHAATTSAPHSTTLHSTSLEERVQCSADGKQWTRASPDADLRCVRLRSHNAFATPADKTESIATRYRPERIVELSDGKMLVAGRVPRTGNTVIELWTVTGPSRTPERELVPARIDAIEDLHDENVEGRRGVLRMQTLPVAEGLPTRVLIQFADSQALYTLDVVTRELKPVAAPTAIPGAFEVPLLSRPLWSFVRRHSDGGVRAVFSDKNAAADQPSVLVLTDAGSDGTFDAFAVMTPAEYEAAGYRSPGAWVD